MKKKGYKVLREEQGILYSAVVQGAEQVTYSLKNPSKEPHPDHPLTYFGSFQDASMFYANELTADRPNSLVVYTRSVQPSRCKPPTRMFTNNPPGKLTDQPSVLSWPDGTAFAKTITLKKEIPQEGVIV